MTNLVMLDVCLSLTLAGSFLCAMPWLDRLNPLVLKVRYFISAYLLLRYLTWRATSTMPELALQGGVVIAYLYLGFELWVAKQGMKLGKLFAMTDRTPEVERHMLWYASRQQPPLVDFLIPTYNEDHATLERAIVGGLSQSYPRVRVWVLDDGRRDWLRELAQEKNVNYLARTENTGFKAGNLNSALAHIAGLEEPSEFFAVLDCDFIAKPEFVHRTLALMHDESVAIVQTKQVYYNLDPFQYALPGGKYLPDWQRWAFDFMAPALDVFNAQTCCGTCFLARTSSFEQIGGMPTESVAEDALASFALNERQMKTIYLAEGLSYGIVAEGLREFLTQCGRWCLGRVQNIFTRWGALSPTKSLSARWAFFEGNLIWGIMTFSRILQLWLPIVYWYFGYALFPVQGTNEGFVNYFVVLWTFDMVTRVWMTNGTNTPIITDARTLLWAEVVFRATYRGLTRSKNYRFEVTDKGALRNRTYVHWKPLRWLLLVTVLTVGGLVYRGFAAYPPPASDYDLFAYFWTFYNLLCLSTAITICIEPPQRREQARFDTSELAVLAGARGSRHVKVTNISVSGALVAHAERLTHSDDLTLDVEGVGAIPVTLVRQNNGSLALAFRAGAEQRASLIRKLFTDRYVHPILIGNVWRIYRGVLRAAFA